MYQKSSGESIYSPPKLKQPRSGTVSNQSGVMNIKLAELFRFDLIASRRVL